MPPSFPEHFTPVELGVRENPKSLPILWSQTHAGAAEEKLVFRGKPEFPDRARD
ncbi:MAG: hypothetical protein ACR2JJ_02860 [Sphingomicrobium sp.]